MYDNGFWGHKSFLICYSITFYFHFLSPVWEWPYGHRSALYGYIFPKFLYPLNNIALSCSTYTTVGIAYERLAIKEYQAGKVFLWKSCESMFKEGGVSVTSWQSHLYLASVYLFWQWSLPWERDKLFSVCVNIKLLFG